MYPPGVATYHCPALCFPHLCTEDIIVLAHEALSVMDAFTPLGKQSIQGHDPYPQ